MVKGGCRNVLICNNWGWKLGLGVTDQDRKKWSYGKSLSVTADRQNRPFLLQIEMFEVVSLQVELGALVVVLEVGGVHS